MSNKPRFEAQVGMYSQIGHGHQQKGGVNEDSMGAYITNPNIVAVAVGDGVGGLPDGQRASATVVGSYITAMRNLSRQPLSPTALVKRSVRYAHEQMQKEKREGLMHSEAATTLVAGVVDLRTGEKILAETGDSYIDRISHDGRLARLSTADETTEGYLTACMDGKGNDPQVRYTRFRDSGNNLTRLLFMTDGADGIGYRDDLHSIRAERARHLNHTVAPYNAAYGIVVASSIPDQNGLQGNRAYMDDTTAIVLDIIPTSR